MEGESQSVEEMGKKDDPLMGPGGMDELPLIWEPVRDVVGQVSGSPQLFDVSLRDGGDHPLASRSRHGWRRLRKRMRTWALQLECAKMDEQRRKKAWMKRWILIPLYGRTKLCVPTSLVKLAYLPSAVINGAVGLPTHVLMRIPG